MKYLVLLIPVMTQAMYRETVVPQRSPHMHVETITRVLKENTHFIDSDNSSLVSDSCTVVEVTLRIHRSDQPVKTIKLNIDI